MLTQELSETRFGHREMSSAKAFQISLLF
jgi:hypothetical protein